MNISHNYRKIWLYTKGLFGLFTILFGACTALIGIAVLMAVDYFYFQDRGMHLPNWAIFVLTGPTAGFIIHAPDIASDVVVRIIEGNKFKTLLQASKDNLITSLQSCAQSNISDDEKIKHIKKALETWNKLQNVYWCIPKFDDIQISPIIMSILASNPENYQQMLDECACNRKSTQGKKHDKLSFKYKHAYQNLSFIPLNKYLQVRYNLNIEPSILTQILDSFDKHYNLAIADRAAALEVQFIQDEIQYSRAKRSMLRTARVMMLLCE